MKILFIEDEVPNLEHSTVSYSAHLFLNLLRERGHEVHVFLPLPEKSLIGDEATRQRWINQLEEQGFHAHCFVVQELPKHSGGLLSKISRINRRILLPSIQDYFPAVRFAKTVAKEVDAVGADVIFIWCGYDGVAVTHGVKTPRFALLGDPAHLPGLYRHLPPLMQIKEYLKLETWATLISIWQKKKQGIRLLKTCDYIGGTAAHHSEWFRKKGLRGGSYLPNMVPDWGGVDWREKMNAVTETKTPFIITMMGHVTGTATLAGIDFLLKKMMPIITRDFKKPFEVHICGKGALPERLNKLVQKYPQIRLLGFVPDIVEEIRNSDVFLVPTPIPLGIRVRIPYAWSVGSCVVAHGANAAGLPELRHGYNCLLGYKAKDIVKQIVKLASNKVLIKDLKMQGRFTYEKEFHPDVTLPKIEAILRWTMLEGKPGRSAKE